MSFIKDDYIFIHIPKTGGVSVKQTLNNAMQSGHETLYEIATAGEDFFGTAYDSTHRIITCCRDPLKRFVSAYYFCKERHPEFNLPNTIHEFIDYPVFNGIHFKPMVDFIWMPEPVKVEVIRLENMDKDFYNLFGIKIPQANPFTHKAARFKNSEKNIIKDYYSKDYKYFNY